jgi:Zn-dependent M28 family amino/carboxypeptidase
MRAWPDFDDREPLASASSGVTPSVFGVSPEMGKRLRDLKAAGGKVDVSNVWDLGEGGASRYAATVFPQPLFRSGVRPGPRPPVVVLSAHFDSFGKQGEALWVGADDNASGVACLLEVMRLLPADLLRGKEDELGNRPDRPGLLVLFVDGEEWGLRGSREDVQRLAPLYDVKAVINVDSIGRAVSKPTHILGLSKHPALARIVRNALEEDGVVVGPDIDAYGYEHGSDHWPFHEAGIPAITLWASDYGVMNTAEDTPEKVEPEGVAKIAAALARLLREDLDALTKVKAPAPPR